MDPLFRVAPVPWIQLDSRLRLGSLLNLRAPYFYVIRIQCYKIAKWNVNFTARLENHVVWSAVVNESSETAKIFTTRFSCFLREKIEFFFSVSPRRILINTHMSFPPMVSFYFVFLYDFYFCLLFFSNFENFRRKCIFLLQQLEISSVTAGVDWEKTSLQLELSFMDE